MGNCTGAYVLTREPDLNEEADEVGTLELKLGPQCPEIPAIQCDADELDLYPAPD